MQDSDINAEMSVDVYAQRPWIVLNTTYDIEAWIDSYNRDLQYAAKKSTATGYGICFFLELGGEIYLHTTQEGDVMLDVTPDAEWVTPIITAATQISPPGSQIWALPGDTLTQLILGLSNLIAFTKIVLDHPFKVPKY
ncbi:hypothetical protein [Glaciimonas sp. PCH181]|uniref:hypothetical protein n=1 Tax=Glaciimonas sp. PCH181 TaxID=2133943 RepID=UPI000D3BC74A|nr:hypothetical protein [Glaciimonas sp. PCH181]PUA17822.1 hypothetical protein C7W93_18350 [Glaciimonas sp. PCH181]